MILILTVGYSAAFFCVLFFVSRMHRQEQQAGNRKGSFAGWTAALFAGALLLRVVIAFTVQGFSADINIFKTWGYAIYEQGFSGVYGGDMFLDYPPGCLYVFGFLEVIRRWLGLPIESDGFTLIMKLPAILADLVCAAGILCFTRRKAGENTALLLSGAFLVCPAMLLNSAAWGQVDSFCSMFLMGALFFLWKEKALGAGISYGLSVLCKPQMLVFAPIFLLWPIVQKKYKLIFTGVGSALAVVILLSLPFSQSWDLLWLPRLYLTTLSSYAYFTVNAYNIWSVFGMNWVALPEGLATTLLTAGAVLPAVACGAWILFRRQNGALFAAGAALMSMLYLLSVKMHERYLLPALVLLLLCCAVRSDGRLLRAFGVLAAANALNVSHVLYMYSTVGNNFDPNSFGIRFLGVLQVGALLYTLYVLLVCFGGLREIPPFLPRIAASGKKTSIRYPEKPLQDASRRMSRVDVLLLLGIMAAYGSVAFWRPGQQVMPQTAWTPAAQERVLLQADRPVDVLYYVPGVVADASGVRYRTGMNLQVEVSEDGTQWVQAGELTKSSVFAWQQCVLPQPVTYVRLTALDESVVLNEVGMRLGGEESLAGITVTSDKDAAALIDEQHSVPLYANYENSTYFDEIYHARTAYEHVLGLEPYENTHPPLGKYLISIGIRAFGMNPFGWRFVGIVSGILMLPLLYHLLKQLLGSTLLSAVGTMLFALDFMHYTITRIATIDTYAVLFLLLMYDAMVVFLRRSVAVDSWKRLLLPLLVCGCALGLGSASKWTALYGAAGLAVLFFGKLVLEWRETVKSGGDTRRLLCRCGILCAWSILLFAVLPFGIYFAVYLPLTTLPHNVHTIWGTFWNYQKTMLDYHSQLQAEHPFSSQWYTWPIGTRPVWYYIKNSVNAQGQYGTIAAMGSPLLWWPCIPALGFAACQVLRRKNLAAAVPVAAFLSVYLPWMFVPRTAFLYHYSTAVPFCIAALMLAWQAVLRNRLLQKRLLFGRQTVTVGAIVLGAYVLGNLVLFVLFFPVLSGMATQLSYVERLRWLSTWYF